MNVLIIGVGLIGGSFALALRDRGLAERIEGVEASEEHARRALERGLVDRIVTLEEGLPSADLIVLATPVDTIPLLTVKILNRIAPHQVVMDTGSIKGELCEVVAMHARRGRFVATHPMWGTEYSGPDAASRGAFAGRTAVICERERSDRDAVETVERLYGALGMPLVSMEPEEHDLHTAYVSHISHITSFALALTVLEKEREEQHIFDLAGGGFESTVRLAKSAPRTWVPILLRNKVQCARRAARAYPPVADHAAHDRARRRRRVDGGHAAGQCHSEDPAVTFPPSADTGRRGEQAAVDYLRRVGFAILERNWRSGRYELVHRRAAMGRAAFHRGQDTPCGRPDDARRGGDHAPQVRLAAPCRRGLHGAASRAARTAVRSGGGRSVSERVSERAFYGAGDGMQLVIWVLTQK